MDKNLTVRIKTKYINEEAHVVLGQYANGALAIQLISEIGEPLSTATVNLPDRVPAEGNIFIKNYRENEGMAKALKDAQIVTKIVALHDAGYVKEGVVEAKLNPMLFAFSKED